MTGNALIAVSVTAFLFIVVALLTPGWFGLDIKSHKTTNVDLSVSMNIFYCRVCVKGDVAGEHRDICTTVSITEAISKNQLNTGSERWTEWTIESIGCLICIVIGTILAVVYGASIRKPVASPAACLASTGLVFNIIAGICGAILTIEFINLHVKYDEVQDYIQSAVASKSGGIEKFFPYSLVLMAIGLFIEFIAVIVHIVAMRTNSRAVPASGIVLSPAVNGTSTVIIQSSTRSNIPYAKFS